MLDEKKNEVLQENEDFNLEDLFENDNDLIRQSEDGIEIKEEEQVEINLGESVAEDVEEDKIRKTKKKGNKNGGSVSKSDNYKYFIYLFVILGITVFVLWFNLASKTGNVDENGNPIYVYQTIGTVFSKVNLWFLALFLGFIFLYYILNSLSLFLYARLYTRRYKFHQAYANNSIGSFYSAITPGASGGQFAQIITFKKQGIPVSNGASIFVMSFIVYQGCLIFLGLISLIFKFNLLVSLNMIPIAIGDLTFSLPIWIFILFGFAINLIVIFLLLFMSYSKKIAHFISVTLVNFLAKIKIVKDPQGKSKEIRIQVENYRIELRRLQSNIPFFLISIFINLLILIVNQLAPFFSGLALNAFDMANTNWGMKIFDCITFMNFHQMTTSLIPLPGSAGVSEIVFGALLGPSSYFYSQEFYAQGGLNILMLVWRFGTFYIPFIINGIIAATYKSRGIPVQDRIIPVANKHTMLTIQLETYQERKVSSDTIYETKMLERKELLDKIMMKEKRKKKTAAINTLKQKDAQETEEIDTLTIGEDDEHSDI